MEAKSIGDSLEILVTVWYFWGPLLSGTMMKNLSPISLFRNQNLKILTS